MVFNSNDIIKIKMFESSLINKIMHTDLYINILNECQKKGLDFSIKVELDNEKKYHSSICISILMDGMLIKENDEPNCSLFIYETICYSRGNKIYAIDLLKDKDFILQENELLKPIRAL